jgi:catechol 2,3-dioxygenase-like lactoylglutathione lyase family enzyme
MRYKGIHCITPYKGMNYMDILNVTLKTNKLEPLKAFYKTVLGCSIERETDHRFELSCGLTTIVFDHDQVADAPFYHFAFDIPANQFQQAKQWVLDRTPLLIENGKDDIYFAFSKAHSLYFEDPAGNIIEFIARLKTNAESTTPFSMASIQRMSEIGLVVEDKMAVAEQLAQYNIFPPLHENVTDHPLTFIGDRETSVYILLVEPERKWLFSPKVSKIFPIDILLSSGVKTGITPYHQFYIE